MNNTGMYGMYVCLVAAFDDMLSGSRDVDIGFRLADV